MERDLAYTYETLAHYVYYWLTRTEPIPEGERDIAHALGQRRFDHFIRQVAKKLGNQRGAAERLEGIYAWGGELNNVPDDENHV